MNFGFSMDFFAVWPVGRRCENCRDAHFFERYCDESIFTWKTFKTTMEKTKNKNKKNSSDPWARSGERPGRGHGSELFVFFVFFWFFHGFLQFGQNLKNTKKTKKKQKVQTHGQGLGHPHTNQKTKKPRNQKTKRPKNKKPKPKKQKTKKNQKDKTQHSASDPLPLGCAILFFLFFLVLWFFCFLGFLVSWFFGFLVFVWIAQTLPMGLIFFFVFLRFWPNCKKPWKNQKKQKDKKPRNQKTKKPKNQKNQKNQDCTPQGEGVRCRVLGLVFLVFLFFWFFGLDSHCRCAKQRLPGTVSGCTRSKVDTLQYSNVCYDIVHSANEQQRGMEFNFVRLRHMLLDLCTGNAAICALPQWPVL